MSTLAIQINNDEQQLYKANNYLGSLTQGAFNFDYSPNSNITDGNGTYFKTIGNSSSNLNGVSIVTTNTSSASPITTGLKVESTTNNVGFGSRNYGTYVSSNGPNSQNVAGFFSAPNPTTFSNTGIAASASNSILNFAIFAEAVNNGTGTANKTIGVHAKGSGGTESVGLWAESKNLVNGTVFGVKAEANLTTLSSSNTWYGVYAFAPIQTCTTGTCAGAAGFFVGDVYATNGSYSSSDFKIKDQMQPVLGASAILAQL